MKGRFFVTKGELREVGSRVQKKDRESFRACSRTSFREHRTGYCTIICSVSFERDLHQEGVRVAVLFARVARATRCPEVLNGVRAALRERDKVIERELQPGALAVEAGGGGGHELPDFLRCRSGVAVLLCGPSAVPDVREDSPPIFRLGVLFIFALPLFLVGIIPRGGAHASLFCGGGSILLEVLFVLRAPLGVVDGFLLKIPKSVSSVVFRFLGLPLFLIDPLLRENGFTVRCVFLSPLFLDSLRIGLAPSCLPRCDRFLVCDDVRSDLQLVLGDVSGLAFSGASLALFKSEFRFSGRWIVRFHLVAIGVLIEGL